MMFSEDILFGIKNRRLSLVWGVVFIIYSLVLMFVPVERYMALKFIFSIMIFSSGVIEIAFTLINRHNPYLWGWSLPGAIIDFMIGAYLIFNPRVSLFTLSFVASIWLILKGFSIIGNSVILKKYGSKEWGWSFFLGFIVISCALAFIWFPLVAAMQAVYVISFACLFIGLLRIMYAAQLKKLDKKAKDPAR